MTVFLVERDDAVRDALTITLETAGIEVRAFGSIDQLQHGCRLSPASCVVVDADLPGLDGNALLQVLHERCGAPPAIATSARLHSHGLLEQLRGSAVLLLEKPFGEEELLPLIWRALGERRQHRRRPYGHRALAGLRLVSPLGAAGMRFVR